MASMKFLLLINLLLAYETLTQLSEEAILKEDENFYREAVTATLNNPNKGITVPGTKWCGPGDNARDYNDLGLSWRTDLCCRNHDHCEEILEPGKQLHDLQNPDWFPRLKCSCEQKFFECLQKVNNIMSKTLRSVYVSSRQYCFDEGYPIVNCTEYLGGVFNMFTKRCKTYKVNELSFKKWQFYDTALYI